MSLILNGTDGLSDVDGTAATPAIRGTDANTGIFFPAADTIAFSEGGVESMRIDASGNLGIGVASPAQKLDVLGSARLTFSGGNNYVEFESANNYVGRNSSGNMILNAAGGNNVISAVGGTTVTQATGAGLFQFNSGYGSVATAYGCRAWVNFDGFGTPAIRASGNVSSITDLGTGVYRVNFSTALVDGNYSVVASNIGSVNTLYYTFITSNNVANSTTSCQFEAVHQSSSINDQASISVAVFR
jgi:hypothetical protein